MTVTYKLENAVATLTLDRPEKLNALTPDMWTTLHGYLDQVRDDENVRAVILTGAGRAFSAGGDVTAMAQYDVISGRPRSQFRHRVITALYNLEKPVIAAVRGPVYGIATALAMACDLIIASETTKFSLSFKKIGLVPDGGAIFFLSQYVGIGRAKELVYTGRALSGQEAHEMGIALKVVPDDKLEAEARALAEEMAQSATYAIMLSKKMFQSLAVPTLEMLMETECLASAIVRCTHDHKEAVAAFKEKRPPKLLGK